MSKSKKTLEEELGPRFTAGDHFTGFEKLVHHLMMCNELTNGYGAYKVSFAGDESGVRELALILFIKLNTFSHHHIF